MARARNASLEDVRARALEAFWRYGYSCTSLSVLEDFTKTGRRSLLNTFGDKTSLFIEVLEDFRRQAADLYLSPMEKPGAGLDAVRETLQRLTDAAASDSGHLGCLICNTAREPVASESEVKGQIEAYFGRIETAFRKALTEASRKGELAPENDPERLAKFFLGVLVSICTLARAEMPKETIEGIASEALARLG